MEGQGLTTHGTDKRVTFTLGICTRFLVTSFLVIMTDINEPLQLLSLIQLPLSYSLQISRHSNAKTARHVRTHTRHTLHVYIKFLPVRPEEMAQ